MPYPTESYPTNSTIEALDGTTDSPTGLVYVARNTTPGSSPSLLVQYNRNWQRLLSIIGVIRQLQVVKEAALTIGVYPGRYRIGATDYSYAGGTGIQGVGGVDLTDGDDDYYVYLTSAGLALGLAWPVDQSTFIPLAIVTVSGGEITTITDSRSLILFEAVAQGGDAQTGIDGTAFTLDQDNGGAGADTELRSNRGSTAGDAALRFSGASGAITALADRDAGTRAALNARTLDLDQTTGTAPMTVASTTVVANLNADRVDGVDVAGGGSLDTGGVVYASGASELSAVAAGTAGDVLVSQGSSAPIWVTPGAGDDAIQVWNALLDAISALSSTGLIARTGAGTAAARLIVGSGAISVTDGDGVAGNPTIAVAGMTEHGVVVGSSGGGLTSLAEGDSNTVLVGNSGANPAFRQIVNDDIAYGADISGAKLADESMPPAKISGHNVSDLPVLRNDGDKAYWHHLYYVADIGGGQSIAPAAADVNVLVTGAISSKKILTLTGMSAGWSTVLAVSDADGIRLVMPGGVTVRDGSSVSASGGYIESTTVGSVVTLIAISDTEVYVASKIGSWTVT